MQHTRRANYQAHVRRQSLHPIQEIPDPTLQGWITDDNGSLEIEWMTYQLVPHEARIFIKK